MTKGISQGLEIIIFFIKGSLCFLPQRRVYHGGVMLFFFFYSSSSWSSWAALSLRSFSDSSCAYRKHNARSLAWTVPSPIWVVKRPSIPTILSSIPWWLIMAIVSLRHYIWPVFYIKFVMCKTPSERVPSGKQIILYFEGLTYVSAISSCSSYSDDVGVVIFCSSYWWLLPVLLLPCATHHPLVWKTCVKSSWQWGHCG